MTPDKNWKNICINHVGPIFSFHIYDDEQLKKGLLKYHHQREGIKCSFLDYQLQFKEAYRFIKIDEKKLTKI